MKRSVRLYAILALAVLLLSLSVLAACGQAPAPVPGQKQKVTVNILPGRPGDPLFVLSYALAEFINQDSTWLRANVIATGGLGSNLSMLIEETQRRATDIGVTSDDSEVYSAENGPGYWKGLDMRVLGMMQIVPTGLVTYDPNIKTLKDLANKRVFFPRPHGWYQIFRAPLEYLGIWNTIKESNGAYGASMNALRDGLVDAAYTVVDYVYPNTWSPGGFVEELSSRRPVYYVSMDPELVHRANQQWGTGDWSFLIKNGSLKQPYDFYWMKLFSYWFVDANLSSDIVEEVLRIIYERQGQFDSYHFIGKGLIDNFFLASSRSTDAEREKYFHPAVVKFAKEQKIEMRTIK
ncbi:MAG: hypothetical protein HYX91_06265 [Chloroflexi bacterium]|nr:hypothetical protein [Chloroflexota bacterium]